MSVELVLSCVELECVCGVLCARVQRKRSKLWYVDSSMIVILKKPPSHVPRGNAHPITRLNVTPLLYKIPF